MAAFNQFIQIELFYRMIWQIIETKVIADVINRFMNLQQDT